MMKKRLACVGRTTNLFSRCNRNNVSTFHQCACLNMKHHACNERLFSGTVSAQEWGAIFWDLERNVFIKFPATSYAFHLICSCNLLKQLLVFPYLKCEDYLSLITTSLRLPSNTQLKSKHFWWVARAGQYQINAKGKHQEMLPSHPFLQNPLTPSPTCGSQASFSFNLLNFLDTTLHKSYYSLTSAAAHRPIWEVDKTESYMAKSKVKTFNSSLILLLDLINRGMYKLIKAGNQDLNV